MNQPIMGPRYITPQERADIYTQKRERAGINRAKAHKLASEDIELMYPHMIVLKISIKKEDRYAIRQWLIEQNITKYEPEIDNREVANASWSRDWRVFRFKNQEQSVLFNMRFL